MTAASPMQTTQSTLAGKPQHTLVLENRSTLTVTGIQAIVSYDATAALLETPLGLLSVGGQKLCVSELSVQTGEVKISGEIEYMQYTAPKAERVSLLQRLVR